MTADLPQFSRPPVGEVTLSVQFTALEELHAAHIGGLWDRWRARYPVHEEHPPVSPMPDETEPGRPQPGVTLTFVNEAPLPRTWFVDDLGEHVLQVQRDRFTLNWRRREGGDYPHYDTLRPRFIEDCHTFVEFLSDESIGEFSPNQCQVTYLNPVPLDGDQACPGGMRGLLQGWTGEYSAVPTLVDGEVAIQVRYPIDGDNGRQGRLHVSARNAVDPASGREVLLLELTARGRPAPSTLDGVLTFLDRGHDAIVSMFAALTTEEMHETWGVER